jgi:NusA-like KH domain protein
MKTINMQEMRHLNLFNKITQVRTRFCFHYNNLLIFSVPKNFVSQAIGKNGENIKKLSEILRSKIKVVAKPESDAEIKKFFKEIVEPVEIKDLEVTDDEIIITAVGQNKAMLIGRNKSRLNELQKISVDIFTKGLSII